MPRPSSTTTKRNSARAHEAAGRAVGPRAEALERGRIAERTGADAELLFQYTAAINRAADLDEVYALSLNTICEILGVDRASILLVDPDGVMRFKAWQGLSADYRAAVEGHTPWTPDDPEPRPVVVRNVADEPSLADFGPLFASEGIVALGFIPLFDRGRLWGKFMTYSREARDFTEHELYLAQTVASIVSQAVARAKLLEAERAARAQAERNADRTRVHQRLTDLLSRPLRVEEVAGVIIEQGTKTLGAHSGALVMLDSARRELSVLRAVGSPEPTTPLGALSIDHEGPLARAASTGEAILENREGASSTCVTFETGVPELDDGALAIACLPLAQEDAVLGCLAFAFREARRFDPDERAFLMALAQSCGQAIDRSRLFELERQARADAEAAQQRTTFLLEASEALSASLEFQETLERVAHLAVPKFADWCAVDFAPDGPESTTHIALAHRDPTKLALAYELRRQYPPTYEPTTSLGDVIVTGKSQLFAFLSDDELAGVARDQHHRELLMGLGIRSAMLVPMVARGRTFGVITLVHADSDRRYHQADLEIAELLGRRAGIAIDNALLYREAQETAAAREEILRIVSHDLRNPLSAIMSSASALLLLDPERTEPDRIRRAIDMIYRGSQRMTRMIEDLLDSASIRAGRLSVKQRPTDLSGIVADVVEAFGDDARSRGIAIQVDVADGMPEVHVDRERMIQVLTNLVSNAFNVVSESGVVGIQARRQNGEAVLAISDTGSGITPDELPRVFERFWRNPKTTNARGTGLGLSIAKGIIEAHGGRIWAESIVGVGSTFLFTMPLAVAREDEAIARP